MCRVALLLLLLGACVVPGAGLYEGAFSFTRTRVSVHENSRVVELTVTRECKRTLRRFCTGRVSVGFSTESALVAPLPGYVTVQDGSTHVGTSVDLRGSLVPGDVVRIGGHEVRVRDEEACVYVKRADNAGSTVECDCVEPFDACRVAAAGGGVAVCTNAPECNQDASLFGDFIASRFRLNHTHGYHGDGLRLSTLALSNRLPGYVVVRNGSRRVTFPAGDIRHLLSVGDLIKIGGQPFVVQDDGNFTQTGLNLDRPFDQDIAREGNHSVTIAYYIPRYTGVSGRPTSSKELLGNIRNGSTQLLTTGDVNIEMGAGDFIKIGVKNYVVAKIVPFLVVLREPYLGGNDAIGVTLYRENVQDRLPGNVTIATGSNIVNTTNDLRGVLSDGDHVKIGTYNFVVRAKNEWNGPGFTDTHFTVDRAHTGLPETKVRGYTNRLYSRLAGRGSVNHNKRRVIHTTARPVALAPGDIIKIGMDNYFLGNNAPDGSFQLLGSRVGASVLSHGFHGRVRRVPAFVGAPNSGTTASMNQDYRRSTGRLVFPRFVSTQKFQVEILDDNIYERPDEEIQVVLYDPRYEDDYAVATRGLTLPGYVNMSVGAAIVGETETPNGVGDDVFVGDMIRVGDGGAVLRVIQVATGTKLVTMTFTSQTSGLAEMWAGKNGNLQRMVKLGPTIRQGSMQIRIFNDDPGVRVEPIGTYNSSEPSQGMLSMALAESWIPRSATLGEGTPLLLLDEQGAELPGLGLGLTKVRRVAAANRSLEIVPLPTRSASKGMVYHTTVPDNPGIISFVKSEYRATEGGGAFKDVHVGLTRMGGSSGRVAVTLGTCEDASSPNCFDAQQSDALCGSFPNYCEVPPRAMSDAISGGSSARLAGTVQALVGRAYVVTSTDLTGRVGRGDLIHVGLSVYSVHRSETFDGTRISLAAPTNASHSVVYRGHQEGRLPMFLLSRQLRGHAHVTNDSSVMVTSSPLMGRVSRGDNIKVGDDIVTLGDVPFEAQLSVGDTHQVSSGTRTGSLAITTPRDVREGFTNIFGASPQLEPSALRWGDGRRTPYHTMRQWQPLKLLSKSLVSCSR